jgi:hypothetical protein
VSRVFTVFRVVPETGKCCSLDTLRMHMRDCLRLLRRLLLRDLPLSRRRPGRRRPRSFSRRGVLGLATPCLATSRWELGLLNHAHRIGLGLGKLRTGGHRHPTVGGCGAAP